MMNNVAMDIVVDSVSSSNNFKKTLEEKKNIFMRVKGNQRAPRISS
jgi:hypothetical protein